VRSRVFGQIEIGQVLQLPLKSQNLLLRIVKVSLDVFGVAAVALMLLQQLGRQRGDVGVRLGAPLFQRRHQKLPFAVTADLRWGAARGG